MTQKKKAKEEVKMTQKKKAKEEVKKTGVKEGKKLTATQKIQKMEQQMATLTQHIGFLSQQMEQLKGGFETHFSTLSKKVEAIVKAGEGGTLSEGSVKDIMTQDRVSELKNLVDSLKDQGVLEPKGKKDLSDERTFLVGQQVDEAGNVVNPRLQFYIDSIENEEVKEKLVGRSVGDILDLEEGQPKLEITELYSIKDVQTNKEYEEPESERKSS